jgi:hypothetical protein
MKVELQQIVEETNLSITQSQLTLRDALIIFLERECLRTNAKIIKKNEYSSTLKPILLPLIYVLVDERD